MSPNYGPRIAEGHDGVNCSQGQNWNECDGTGLSPVRVAAMERRGEFAASGLQTQSYLGREHNARWAVLGVAQIDTPKSWTKVR